MADLHSEIVDAPLPWGPNSFNFVQFLGKFGKIICWYPLEGWCPHLRDILDLSPAFVLGHLCWKAVPVKSLSVTRVPSFKELSPCLRAELLQTKVWGYIAKGLG